MADNDWKIAWPMKGCNILLAFYFSWIIFLLEKHCKVDIPEYVPNDWVLLGLTQQITALMRYLSSFDAIFCTFTFQFGTTK